MQNALKRIAADDSVFQRLDYIVAVFYRGIFDTVYRAAVFFVYNDVLRNVDQAAGKVTGVCGFKRGVGQTFAGAVRRNKEFDNGKTFFKVCADRKFDNIAVRLCHKAAHSGKLTDLVAASAGAGGGHHVNRVKAFFVVFELFHHHVRKLFVGF